MPSAPRVSPISGLQVAAPPPPSSSVKTTLLPSLLKVAECQNAKFSSSWTRLISRGAVRSEVAEVPFGNGLPSPGLPPSGKSTGSAAILACVGCRSGTSTMVILSCGGWQSDWVTEGPYEEMYRYAVLPRLSGTSVWVCEPQSVSTDLR